MSQIILIVEDTLQTKNLMQKIVGHLCPEHTVVSVDNGGAALTYMSQHKPCLVFTDLEMPGLSGYELITMMNDNSNNRDIPVVVVTAHADRLNDSRVVRQLTDRGLPACPVVGKPLDIGSLKEVIVQVLGVGVA